MSKQDSIFVVSGSGHLREVVQETYESEDLLQRLIDDYPDLLSGQQINPDAPLRWLPVGREVGVPDSEGGADRWSVDHLLIDQDGTPTFVEVKRASDTRIRREVVGQLLDYAANAQKYWPVGRLRALAEARAGGSEQLAEVVLDLHENALDGDLEQTIETYWEKVESRLRQGEIRLVFVADRIPSELRRAIEFLNEQMQRVHVVGLELVQYHRDGLRVIVPRAVGQTEAARSIKARSSAGSSKGPKTNRDGFLAACPPDARPFFARVLDEAGQRGMTVYWGTKGFSLRTVSEHHGMQDSVFYGFPPGAHGHEQPYIQVYMHKGSFPEDARSRWRERFRSCAPMVELGQYTLQLSLSAGAVEQADKVVDALWELEAELRAPSSSAAS